MPLPSKSLWNTPRDGVTIVLALIMTAGCECDDGLRTLGPALTLSPAPLAFGTVCVGEAMQQRLTLQNVGAVEVAPVVMLEGDGWLPLTQTPSSLPAGASAELTVDFAPPFAGTFNGSVRVLAAEGGRELARAQLNGVGGVPPRSVLEVACETEPLSGLIDAAPCPYLHFGAVETGSARVVPLELRSTGCGPVQLSAPRFDGSPEDTAGFGLPEPWPTSLAGGTTARVALAFAPQSVAGVPQATLRLESDDAASGVREIPLLAEALAPSLSLWPELLNFAGAAVGTELTRTITIENSGSSAVTLSEIVIEPAGAYRLVEPSAPQRIEPAGAPGDHRELRIAHAPTGTGTPRARLRVVWGDTTHGGELSAALVASSQPRLEVDWRRAIDAPWQASPVDWGDITAGARDLRRTLRLRNTGEAPLQLSAVSIEPSSTGFRLINAPPMPTALAPGGEQLLELALDDDAGRQDDSARLVLETDDPSDLASGGLRRISLSSRSDANLAPVPRLRQCTDPDGTGRCSSGLPSVGTPLWWDAGGSSGPEAGDHLSYAWTLEKKPAGSAAVLRTDGAAVARLVSPAGDGPDRASATEPYIVALELRDDVGNRTVVRRVATVTR